MARLCICMHINGSSTMEINVDVVVGSAGGQHGMQLLQEVERLASAHDSYPQLWAICNWLADAARLHDHMAAASQPTTLEGYGPAHSMAEFVFDRSGLSSHLVNASLVAAHVAYNWMVRPVCLVWPCGRCHPLRHGQHSVCGSPRWGTMRFGSTAKVLAKC